jgi:hypothetical protein
MIAIIDGPAVCSVITGVRNIQQLENNLSVTNWQLTPEEFARLDEISLPVRDYTYYVWDPEVKQYIKVQAGRPL